MSRAFLGELWCRARQLGVIFYRWRNRCKPRVFLFADSRAVDVRRRYTKRDPLNFYPLQIVRGYCTIARIVPYRHTTIMDFLWEYEQVKQWADLVVAHVGIVDFSPRPRDDAQDNIYRLKKAKYDNVFGEDYMRMHLAGDLKCNYEGKPTTNMFSLDATQQFLIPQLRKIRGLVFVGCNRIVPGWEGTYYRGRPKNITIINEYSRVLTQSLAGAVSFDDWTDPDIKHFTVDNIHYSPEGNAQVSNRILTAIHHMLGHLRS